MAWRPIRPFVAGGPPLLALFISALLLLLLWPRSAHAGWGGVDDRKNPRLAIKKPGTTRQVAPGKQFNVAVNIKKALRRVPALFEVVLPDGALFVGPKGHQPKQTKKGRTPAPTAASGWKAKRAAARRFPLPDTVVNGTAGERTLQWHLETFPPRHNPIKLTFEVDFCGAPSPLEIRLNWWQGGRSARPAVITVSFEFEVVGLMAGIGSTHVNTGETLSFVDRKEGLAHKIEALPALHIYVIIITVPSSTCRLLPMPPPRRKPSLTGTRRWRPTHPSCSSPATAPIRPTRGPASSASTTRRGCSTTGDVVRSRLWISRTW